MSTEIEIKYKLIPGDLWIPCAPFRIPLSITPNAIKEESSHVCDSHIDCYSEKKYNSSKGQNNESDSWENVEQPDSKCSYIPLKLEQKETSTQAILLSQPNTKLG